MRHCSKHLCELGLDGAALGSTPSQTHSVWGSPGTDPAHVVSNNSSPPPIVPGFISKIGVNFLIYYLRCLSFPLIIPSHCA